MVKQTGGQIGHAAYIKNTAALYTCPCSYMVIIKCVDDNANNMYADKSAAAKRQGSPVHPLLRSLPLYCVHYAYTGYRNQVRGNQAHAANIEYQRSPRVPHRGYVTPPRWPGAADP